MVLACDSNLCFTRLSPVKRCVLLVVRCLVGTKIIQFWSACLKCSFYFGKGTLSETSIANEHQWLEDAVSFRDGLFSGPMLASGSVCIPAGLLTNGLY